MGGLAGQFQATGIRVNCLVPQDYKRLQKGVEERVEEGNLLFHSMGEFTKDTDTLIHTDLKRYFCGVFYDLHFS